MSRKPKLLLAENTMNSLVNLKMANISDIKKKILQLLQKI